MNLSLLNFIFVASFFLGYFTSLSLLISPFFKSKANNYLSASLFILTTMLLFAVTETEVNIIKFLDKIMWEFLIPVTLFIYFLLQLNHPYLKKRWVKWLFLPFLGFLTIDTFLDLDFVFGFYNLTITEDSLWIDLYYNIEEVLSLIFNIVLMVLSYKFVKNSKAISKEKRKWLLGLIWFFFIILSIWFLATFEDIFLDSEIISIFLWGMISCFFWWILYYGIFKLQIVTQKDEIHQLLSKKSISIPKIDKRKTKNSSKYIKELYRLMDEEELYKNPLLSRQELAKKIDISESLLSNIINQELSKTYIQFINEYRIVFAKSLLNNTTFNHYSIEAIGMEAGFNSKSSFFKVFKNQQKMSPGAYRKLQKNS